MCFEFKKAFYWQSRYIILSIIVGCFFTSGSLVAQNRIVPPVVRSAFINMYPGVRDESWQSYTKDYIASFFISGHKVKATFTEKGQWVSSAMEISQEQLPEAVILAFKKTRYKDTDISVVNVISSVNQLLLYEIRFSHPFQTVIKLYFDVEGNMVSPNVLNG